MSKPDLDAIQARADAATEGPWHAGRGATSDGKEFVRTYEQKAAFLALSLHEGESDLWLVDNDAVIPAATGDGPKAKENAEFIAAARTDVPDLLAVVRSQQAKIERVRELHAPCQMFEYDDVNGVFVLDAGEKVVMSTICSGCTPDEVIEDAEDWSFDESRAVTWPCPTIAALTATEGA